MSQQRHEDQDAPPAELGELAPRQAWVSGLEQLGHDAAHLRIESASWMATAGRAAPWFLPAAAAAALACWWLAARGPSAGVAPTTPALAAGSSREATRAMFEVTLRGLP